MSDEEVKATPPGCKPAWEQNWALQQAYDFLNEKLFAETLPSVMLTLSRNNNIVGGFYTPKRWFNEDGAAVGEIAINANCLKSTGIVRAMTVLCHEMVHLWQYTYGTPSRAGYHNSEWANKCKVIGLRPYGVDGKEVGQTIDTDLIPDGAAEKAIADMPEEFTLPWMTEPMDNPYPEGGGGSGDGKSTEKLPPPDPSKAPVPRKPGTRNKYTCPACGFNLWGKPGGHFECLDCSQAIVEMVGPAGDDA